MRIYLFLPTLALSLITAPFVHASSVDKTKGYSISMPDLGGDKAKEDKTPDTLETEDNKDETKDSESKTAPPAASSEEKDTVTEDKENKKETVEADKTDKTNSDDIAAPEKPEKKVKVIERVLPLPSDDEEKEGQEETKETQKETKELPEEPSEETSDTDNAKNTDAEKPAEETSAKQDETKQEAEQKEQKPAKQDAQAKEPEEPQKRPAILQEDLKKLESTGLYSNPQDGALGRDLWNKAKRTHISALIEKLPVSFDSEIERRLAFGLLVTAANAGLIDNDKEAEPGRDLLTLRAQKLLEMGAHDKVIQLFGVLEREPYHPALAEIFIKSMLLGGDKSLSCLEYKTFEDRDFPQDGFWSDLKLYCNYVLSSGERQNDMRKAMLKADDRILRALAEDKDYSLDYSPIKFVALSMTSKAFLRAENRIELTNLSSAMINNIPPQDLLLLLGNKDMEPELEYLLSAKALEHKLITHSDFNKLNKRIAADDSIKDQSWAKIPALLLEAENERDEDKEWSIIQTALEQSRQMGSTIYARPFSKILEEIKPRDIPSVDIMDIFTILLDTGKQINNDWFDVISSKLNGEKPSLSQDLDTALYAVSMINLPSYRLQENDFETLNDNFMQNNPHKLYFMKNVLESLDKFAEHIHNPEKIYEKSFDLAEKELYKVNHIALSNALARVSLQENIAETVALSIFMLNGTSPEELSPEDIIELVESYKNVGFTSVSKDLIASYLLGHAKKL